jgi:hypothetical protein
MSIFGNTKGFVLLLAIGGGVTAWLVSRDYTTDEQLVAMLKRKNNNALKPTVSGEQKFTELFRQLKDPSDNKTFDDLLKRGTSGRSTPLKPIILPPAPADEKKDMASGEVSK